MNIDGTPVNKGSFLFFTRVTPSGNTLYKGGTVVDINEHVKAVKLEYAVGKDSLKREWFPAAKLCWKEPEIVS